MLLDNAIICALGEFFIVRKETIVQESAMSIPVAHQRRRPTASRSVVALGANSTSVPVRST